VLGVGLGVPPDVEYGAFGESAEPRHHAALLDEGLAVVDALWSGEPVTHDGQVHHLDGVRFAPQPVQRPRVPVWSACSLPARAGVRRAARWDGIAPVDATAEEFRPATPEEVAGIVAEVGATRPIDGFDVVVFALAPDEALRREYADAGATWLIEGPAPGEDWLDDAMSIATAGPPPP
jgi:alkanesulfonate monooxygenase SsuD/methylene tetrahydromethanopterin reductase-like flavin-dependent oxidoreductase (luciferase family)